MRSMRVDDSCPYCKNRKLLRGFNDLATTYPELVAEWDRDRNGDLRPDGIVSGSARRVWWRCGRGHAWQISAYNRTGGADRGCPYCGDRKVLKGYNDLRATHPRIAREWNKERSGDLEPTDVIASSSKRVWWKCEEGHEWSGLIASRARRGKADPGCPYCSGRKVLAGYNDLAATHPGIAAMWHPRMNKRLKPAGVQAVSRKPAWWRGECGHVCQMAVRDRARAKPGYCPYCSGRKRPERPIRLDWPSAPRRGRNGGGGRSVPPAYRRDLANIGLDGYARQLWGSASFSMAGFMYASTLMRRIVPLGICPNGTICYPIRRRLFGAGSSPMKVGMSCKSLEAQTPEDK